jgi:hypothetical protein
LSSTFIALTQKAAPAKQHSMPFFPRKYTNYLIEDVVLLLLSTTTQFSFFHGHLSREQATISLLSLSSTMGPVDVRSRLRDLMATKYDCHPWKRGSSLNFLISNIKPVRD